MWEIGQSSNRQDAKWRLKRLTSVYVQRSKQLHHVPKLVLIGKPIPVQHNQSAGAILKQSFCTQCRY